MSVDSENPEDDLIFEDDEFPADEPDAEQDKFAFGDAEGESGEAPGGEGLGQVFDPDRAQAESTDWEGAAEDENFFADQSFAGEPTESFSSGREFSEQSGAGWGGQRTDPEEIGIPTENDLDPLKSDSDQVFDLDAEGEELQLVEHESELDTFESAAVETDYVLADEGSESDAAEMEYVLADEEVSDEWAPVATEGELATEEESYVLADDQDEVYADEPQPEYAAEGEPDYAEYEESYVEVHDGYETAEVEPRRRFRLVSMVSGMAAACLIAAAGTVVVMKPGLFGLKVEPDLVDVVQIDRPRVDLTVAVPVLAPIVVTPDPVVPDPVTPDPVVPDPVTPDPVTLDPVVATPDPTVGPDSGPIQLGEMGIAIGEYGEENNVVVEHPLTAGIAPGSQAFAQLKNGNFFIGKVKTVNAPINITLSVKKGEVTLALAELRTLASLGSEEYMELQRSESGYVRLRNNNLLRGTILRYGRDDNVILEMKANQILIPKDVIEEMGNQSSDFSIRLDESTDNDWVRRLVEEEMVRNSGPNPLGGNTERLRTLPVFPGVNRDR